MKVRAIVDPKVAPRVGPDESAWVTDVLRFCSTVVTAFDRGCGRVFLLSKSDKLHLVRTNRKLLTVGEKFGEQIAGFDLNNSPTAIAGLNLEGHEFAVVTTNGTGRVLESTGGTELGLFCFLNLEATAEHLLRRNQPLVLVAAGRRGGPAIEDSLAIGALIDRLSHQKNDLELDPTASECRAAWLTHEPRLAEALVECDTGRHLSSLGYGADLPFCAQRNISSRVVTIENASSTLIASCR